MSDEYMIRNLRYRNIGEKIKWRPAPGQPGYRACSKAPDHEGYNKIKRGM